MTSSRRKLLNDLWGGKLLIQSLVPQKRIDKSFFIQHNNKFESPFQFSFYHTTSKSWVFVKKNTEGLLQLRRMYQLLNNIWPLRFKSIQKEEKFHPMLKRASEEDSLSVHQRFTWYFFVKRKISTYVRAKKRHRIDFLLISGKRCDGELHNSEGWAHNW